MSLVEKLKCRAKYVEHVALELETEKKVTYAEYLKAQAIELRGMASTLLKEKKS